MNDSFVILLPYVISPMTFEYLETVIPSPKPSPGHPVRFLNNRGSAHQGHKHLLAAQREAMCRMSTLCDLP